MRIYRHAVKIHWGDLDPANIVFYPNYYSWFDESAQLLFAAAGLGWAALKDKYGVVGIPIVEAKARFLVPSKHHDDIVIESCIPRWNEKTFEVKHTVFKGATRAVEGYEIRAWCKPHPEDAGRIKAFTIPPEVRAAFE